jgi:hypothetical protein
MLKTKVRSMSSLALSSWHLNLFVLTHDQKAFRLKCSILQCVIIKFVFDRVFKMLNSTVNWIVNTSGRWTKSENPISLCVIHHRQNPIVSTWVVNVYLCTKFLNSHLYICSSVFIDVQLL